MRESIGATFVLNFILLFIFLVFAFLGGTLSYYKAYRINNYIVHSIEMYEGYNRFSLAQIRRGLANLGYETFRNPGCAATYVNPSRNFLASSSPEFGRLHPEGRRENMFTGTQEEGYCIYLFSNDNGVLNRNSTAAASTDVYYTYGVLTYMFMRFPGVDWFMRVPVYSRTRRMYDFNASMR